MDDGGGEAVPSLPSADPESSPFEGVPSGASESGSEGSDGGVLVEPPLLVSMTGPEPPPLAVLPPVPEEVPELPPELEAPVAPVPLEPELPLVAPLPTLPRGAGFPDAALFDEHANARMPSPHTQSPVNTRVMGCLLRATDA